jgi:hypothetical protein
MTLTPIAAPPPAAEIGSAAASAGGTGPASGDVRPPSLRSLPGGVMSLYELRWRWMTHRRSLGRSTGTRTTWALGWSLIVEGVILAVAEWWGLTWALGRKW